MRKTIVGLGVGSRHDPTRPCRAACLGRKRHCRRRFRACQPVISVPITESDREFRYRTEGRSCLASTRRWLRSCGRRRVDAIDCVVFTGLLGLLAPKHGFDRARFSVFCGVLPGSKSVLVTQKCGVCGSGVLGFVWSGNVFCIMVSPFPFRRRAGWARPTVPRKRTRSMFRSVTVAGRTESMTWGRR